MALIVEPTAPPLPTAVLMLEEAVALLLFPVLVAVRRANSRHSKASGGVGSANPNVSNDDGDTEEDDDDDDDDEGPAMAVDELEADDEAARLLDNKNTASSST